MLEEMAAKIEGIFRKNEVALKVSERKTRLCITLRKPVAYRNGSSRFLYSRFNLHCWYMHNLYLKMLHKDHI